MHKIVITIFSYPSINTYKKGLSGRVFDSRLRGLTSVTALWSLSKTHYPSLILVQPRKTRPCLTERLYQTNKQNINEPTHEILVLSKYVHSRDFPSPDFGPNIGPFPIKK